MVFVSTGRSGTTRLAEILKLYLPETDFTVVHQVKQSRVCNILGTMMFHFGSNEWLKKKLWNWVVANNAQAANFITTDPLVSLIIPKSEVSSKEVYIVNIKRSDEGFAKSMFQFTRGRRKSFIAHNFFPFWQPYLWPLENYLSANILEKYKKVSRVKESFFIKNYKGNAFYRSIKMEDLFTGDTLNKIVSEAFGYEARITQEALDKKSNQSKTNQAH